MLVRRPRPGIGPRTPRPARTVAAQHRSLATGAAVGAVATGTFTALVPSGGDGVATSAAADEAPITATLAAHTAESHTDTTSLSPPSGPPPCCRWAR